MWRKVMVVGTLTGLVLGGSAAGRVHTVRRGDTLEAIGRRYNVPVPTLVAANRLGNADRLLAGTALSIPAPRPVPVRRAATAGSLRETVVRMPATQLASARPPIRILVPVERAGLRNAFLRFSRLAGVPSDLAMALAWQESGWQRNKVSSTQAVGVMQLMPDTVDFVSRGLLGVAPLDPRDPLANIRMGTRFVRYLLDANGGDVDRALASYYQGLRSVRENGPLDETRRFVANVKALRGRL
ncbi:MAG TPA: LysM peptidoglycan-binding domain-containing protein [Acidimicrobiia bacterium]|jgi:soluble lytic murein transglycosylase-like protein|nr:LysM peptidoglycan-binding domain-containing protein [Acidimicrobiia bacterium]